MLRALLSLSFWGFRLAYALPTTPIISQYCDIFRLWLVFFNGFRVFRGCGHAVDFSHQWPEGGSP